MKAGMQIGGTDFTNVEDPAEDLIKIITVKADVDLRLAAVQAYSNVAEVKNVTIQNCTVVGDKTVNIDKELLEE